MKHNIDVEGLPEGWELEGVSITPSRTKDINDCWRSASVKLRRIQPRRIVLEETDRTQPVINENGNPQWFYLENKWWKEVKE